MRPPVPTTVRAFLLYCAQLCHFCRLSLPFVNRKTTRALEACKEGAGVGIRVTFSTPQKRGSWQAYRSLFTHSPEPRKVIIIDEVSNSLARNCFSRVRINEGLSVQGRGRLRGARQLITHVCLLGSPLPAPHPTVTEAGRPVGPLQGFVRKQ